jgi:hypothetical protein
MGQEHTGNKSAGMTFYKIGGIVQMKGGLTHFLAKGEGAVGRARDWASDIVDASVASLAKTYVGVTATIETIKTIGVTVALLAAPVPTLVGLAIMWLIEEQVRTVKEQIDDAAELRKRRRAFERAATLLKKYGTIPETAILETEWVRLDLNSASGAASGVVIKGPYRGRSLESIGASELAELTAAAPDGDTRLILEGWNSLQSAKTSSM